METKPQNGHIKAKLKLKSVKIQIAKNYIRK